MVSRDWQIPRGGNHHARPTRCQLKGKMEKYAERLIVAGDVEDSDMLLSLLRNTGVVYKENVELRNGGYSDSIKFIHEHGLRYCADVKLIDIGKTLRREGKLLRKLELEMLTVMCSSSLRALQAIREELPETEILGVTVPTDFDEEDCRDVYNGRSIEDQVKFFAARALKVRLNGVVCAPREIPLVQEIAGDALKTVVANIRPEYLPVLGDDQNPERAMTPTEAINAGADKLIVGRPITQAKDPGGATTRIINEIALAFA